MTSAGVDIRHLEDNESDAPMKMPTASLDLRIAIAQARQVDTLSLVRAGQHPGRHPILHRKCALTWFAVQAVNGSPDGGGGGCTRS